MNPLTKMRVRNFFLGVGGQLGLSLSPFGQDRQDQAQQEIFESSENPHDGFTFVGKDNQKLKVESCRVAISAENQSIREGDSITTADNSVNEGNKEVNPNAPQDSAAQTDILQISHDSVRTVITPSISFLDFKSYSDNSVSRLSIMKSLLTSFPPSAADIKASADVLLNLPEEDAAEIFRPFPGLLESLSLDELRSDPEQFSAVLSKATETLQVKNKWANFFDERAALHGEEQDAEVDAHEQEIAYIPQELLDNHGTWDALTDKYKCSICQDVKAAPVVLSCEHNFCFVCIEAHKNSCKQDSAFQNPQSHNACYPLAEEEDIVVHKCPNCKTEIKHDGLYERDLDETIYQLVGRIGDTDPVTGEDLSERKAAYYERRKAHQNAMWIKRQQQQYQKGQQGEAGEQSAESGSSTPGYEWYLPIVMFALVAIIALLRR